MKQHSISLFDLPPAPIGKTGWPWTDSSAASLLEMPGIRSWPRITVVTPSFNQGMYIEETIRSVLLQNYPNLEYFVLDGGSTDQSREIIEKYAPWLAYWVSERDGGQTQAINKGLARATGDVFNWINSDDLLAPGCLIKIGHHLGTACAVAGAVEHFEENGHFALITCRHLCSGLIVNENPGCVFSQPGIWYRKSSLVEAGGIDESLQFAFDWDLLLRFTWRYEDIVYLPDVLARFRVHPLAKTQSQWPRFEDEKEKILSRIAGANKYGVLANICSNQLRLMKWRRKLSEETSNSDRLRILRMGEVLLRSVMDPDVRWSRETIAALVKIFLGRHWVLFKKNK